ncbi:MAG: hypothetical protein AB1397_07530 [bacterium]
MKKKFDAVKMMRDIRNELVDGYLKNPELEAKDLYEIREKYNIKKKKKKKPHFQIKKGR